MKSDWVDCVGAQMVARELLPPVDGGELTDSEKRLLECARLGSWWCPGNVCQEFEDFSNAAEWPKEYELRVEVIYCLITGTRWGNNIEPWSIHPRGARIANAKIVGKLDLTACKLMAPLCLLGCYVEEQIVLTEAITWSLDFSYSHIKEILAPNVHVHGDLYVQNAVVTGGVNISGARINGEVNCSKTLFGTIAGPSPERSVREGEDIQKLPWCGFFCTAAVIGERVSLVGIEVYGQVRLANVLINGDLDYSGAMLHGAIYPDLGDKNLISIEGVSCKIGKDVILANGFDATGWVGFQRTEIEGVVDCRGGAFRAGLSLEFATVKAALYFEDITAFVGLLDLDQTSVTTIYDDKSSWLDGKTPNHIWLDGFTYRRLDRHNQNRSQGGTPCADWRDRLQWLRLQPLGHLREDFRPQPWVQLERVLRDMGHEEDAKRIAIERIRTYSKSSKVGFWGKVYFGFIGATVGYGYVPTRALAWSVLFVFLGWLTFLNAAPDFIAPRDGSVITYFAGLKSAEENKGPGVNQFEDKTPDKYPRFNALVYALDVYLPVIELGQDQAWVVHVPTNKWTLLSDQRDDFRIAKSFLDACTPRVTRWPAAFRTSFGSAAGRMTGSLTGCGTSLVLFGQRFFDGHWRVVYMAGLHRIVYWFEEFLGWVFISLFVAGMGGLMKSK